MSSNKDFISEEDFTKMSMQMPTLATEDSPEGSDVDQNTEVLMGADFDKDERNLDAIKTTSTEDIGDGVEFIEDSLQVDQG